MELPTGVLAYKLLKSIVIFEDKQQLALATMASFTYDDMKKQLKQSTITWVKTVRAKWLK